jgi:hypothetical protein
MKRPASELEQVAGKVRAELFRGSAHFPYQPHAVSLEPPYAVFDWQKVNAWDCFCNTWEGPYVPPVPQSQHLHVNFNRYYSQGLPFSLPALLASPGTHVGLEVKPFPEDDDSMSQARAFLASLPLGQPLAFEAYAFGGKSGLRFVCSEHQQPQVATQLLSYYPNAGVKHVTNPDEYLFGTAAYACTFRLKQWYVYPLSNLVRINHDPWQSVFALFDRMTGSQWALLQVVFQRATQPWVESAGAAVKHHQDANLRTILKEKFSVPLFAAAVRIVASELSTRDGLVAWAHHFSQHSQVLEPVYPQDKIDWEAFYAETIQRGARRPGMLLNLAELASLVHLPAHCVVSHTLQRITQVTRQAPPPPSPLHQCDLHIGYNTHREVHTPVVLDADTRARHTLLTGTTGTGKSTFILNQLLSDLRQGTGFGIIDPHGEFFAAKGEKNLLDFVPPERIRDVVYFDPLDRDYPMPFNLLFCPPDDELSRELVPELFVGMAHRFLAEGSWGPQLQQLLLNAAKTVTWLPGGNVLHVERLLTDAEFREMALTRVKDSRVQDFWARTWPRINTSQALGPVLNKLSPLLDRALLRNLVCQPACLNFDRIIDGKTIFLANLSGGLPASMMELLGTFLVTGFYRAALKRARRASHLWKPFHLVIDEFQAFANFDIPFDQVLRETRKFGLHLTMAIQNIREVENDLRKSLGNAAAFVVFRPGTNEDSELLAKELPGFPASSIMQMHAGQAIVRNKNRGWTVNVNCLPPPQKPGTTSHAEIVQYNRLTNCRPRAEVEHDLLTGPERLTSLDTAKPPIKRSPQPAAAAPKAASTRVKKPPKPASKDPSIDDLLS